MSDLNSEQIKAVEHQGGVILQAGAGSGKTTVLVEHILYLLEQFERKKPYSDEPHYKKELITYLGSIVVMTFTNKAAGEFSTRLNSKLKAREGAYWKTLYDLQGNIFMGTIHGFCHRLMTSGMFPHINTKIQIINELEQRDIIERSYQNWIQKQDDDSLGIKEMFLSHSEEMMAAIIKVLDDAQLRIFWNQDKVGQFLEKNYVAELLEAHDFEELLGGPKNFVEAQGVKLAWAKNLATFNNALAKNNLDSIESLVLFYEEIKGIRAANPKEEELSEIAEYLNVFKEFKNSFKKNVDNFKKYLEHKDGIYPYWPTKLAEAFNHIQKDYNSSSKLRFSDLEYLTLEGLSNKKSLQRIRSQYRYFIVDEFQDTSAIQFNIIKKFIDNDFSKLFVVGDIKQAIYGFRGGEIEVFRNCISEMPTHLSLLTNYRSHKKVIEFNNDFFNWLLSVSFHYRGHDPLAVKGEGQVPNESKIEGEIHSSLIHIDLEEQKLTPTQINSVESYFLLERILELRQKNPDDQIAILYKKLSSSASLITYLLGHDQDFSAQIKVPFSEDPVIGLFKCIVEAYNQISIQQDNFGINLFKIVMSGYLELLNQKLDQDVQELYAQFVNDYNIFGLQEAFKKYLYRLGLSNSNYKSNLDFINDICLCSKDIIDRAYQLISDNSDHKYSIEFQIGQESNKIIIMTTHMSKGLQFDHVLLGGIHTNGIPPNRRGYIGQLPESFKWKTHSSERESFKSPNYILEELVQKKKEFSESKRLFYVACTRAIKSINWIDLQGDSRGLRDSENSWVEAFRRFGDHSHITVSEQEFMWSDLQKKISHKKITRPLFHLDSLGVIPRESSALILSSELSVTRLSTLTECPRKFFFTNICKMDQKQVFKAILEDEEEEIVSSSKRGSRLHLALSKYLLGKDYEELLKNDDLKAFEFAVSELNKLDGYELISERALKFELFGQMISGVPDLIAISKDKTCQIIDFKSGSLKENHSPYWFQLFCYGYACYWYGLIPKDRDIHYKLMFLDQNKIATEEKSFIELKQELFGTWKKIDHIGQKNLDHCSDCEFRAICSS